MPVTNITLRDGVWHNCRRITQLSLRPIVIGDYDAITAVSTMPGVIGILARLSSEPFDALSLMTQDDALLAITALNGHLAKHAPVGAR